MTIASFLQEAHAAAVSCSKFADHPAQAVIQYFDQLAATQDDIRRCTLLMRMRDRVEENGFSVDLAAYVDLLGDDEMQETIELLIQTHLAEEDKAAALEWLRERIEVHVAMTELGLIDKAPIEPLIPPDYRLETLSKRRSGIGSKKVSAKARRRLRGGGSGNS